MCLFVSAWPISSFSAPNLGPAQGFSLVGFFFSSCHCCSAGDQALGFCKKSDPDCYRCCINKVGLTDRGRFFLLSSVCANRHMNQSFWSPPLQPCTPTPQLLLMLMLLFTAGAGNTDVNSLHHTPRHVSTNITSLFFPPSLTSLSLPLSLPQFLEKQVEHTHQQMLEKRESLCTVDTSTCQRLLCSIHYRDWRLMSVIKE